MALENIGKISRYEHKQRIVEPLGLITSPKLILKYYGMCVAGKSFKEEYVQDYKEIIKTKIEKKEIKPLSGLGFTILSEDMANVAVWDKKNPIVLKNKIYVPDTKSNRIVKGWEDSDTGIEAMDINKEGAFCIWELGIVNHERNLWKNYLQSGRKETDKKAYLASRIEGLL